MGKLKIIKKLIFMKKLMILLRQKKILGTLIILVIYFVLLHIQREEYLLYNQYMIIEITSKKIDKTKQKIKLM